MQVIKRLLFLLMLSPMLLSATMVPTKVSITLANGKIIPAVKYESDKVMYEGKAPLIIYLSGRGEQVNTNATQANIDAAYKRMLGGSQSNLMENAEAYGFKVVVPLFILEYNGWQPDFTGGTYPRDVANWAIANMDIDPLRMIPVGWSSGGNGAFYAATSSLEIANMWAAIVPICSGGVAGGWVNIKSANLPVWMFCSKTDEAISFGTSTANMNALQSLSMRPVPIFTVYNSSSHSGTMQTALRTADLFAWLKEQRSDYTPPVVEPPAPKKIVSKVYFPDGAVMTIYDDKTTALEK